MVSLRLSFDLRRPPFTKATTADLAAAMLDIVGWADGLGFDLVYFGEHHSADDGYLPSPLAACAAAAGRTSRLCFRPIILTPLYHPVRLAEDIAVIDLLSAGRMRPVFAAGYRGEEFDLYGVSRASRRRRLADAVQVCKDAWTGEPFEFEGRTLRVTPTPAQQPRPPITLGASAEVSARRAAHIADGLDPGDPRIWDFYRDECAKVGRPDPGPWIPRGPTFLYVTHDPERAWATVGPNLLHAANSYAQWIAASEQRDSPWYPPIAGVAELRAGGAYQIVTPEQCVEIARGLGDEGHLILRPLFGGTEPAAAWESLDLFAGQVVPHLTITATERAR